MKNFIATVLFFGGIILGLWMVISGIIDLKTLETIGIGTLKVKLAFPAAFITSFIGVCVFVSN